MAPTSQRNDDNRKSFTKKVGKILGVLASIVTILAFFGFGINKIIGEKSDEVNISVNDYRPELYGPNCFVGAVDGNAQDIAGKNFLEVKNKISKDLKNVNSVSVVMNFSLPGKGQYVIKNVRIENVKDLESPPRFYIVSMGGCGAAGDSSSVIKIDLDKGTRNYHDSTGRYDEVGGENFINTSVQNGGSVTLNVNISTCRENKKFDLVVDYIDDYNPEKNLEYRVNDIILYGYKSGFDGQASLFRLTGTHQESVFEEGDFKSFLGSSCS